MLTTRFAQTVFIERARCNIFTKTCNIKLSGEITTMFNFENVTGALKRAVPKEVPPVKGESPEGKKLVIQNPDQNYWEKAKEDTFEDIRRKIAPLIEAEKYDEANHEIKQELNLLAGAMGGDKSDQLIKLQQELGRFLPEREREASAEAPDVMDARGEKEKRIRERTWKIPELDEIKPGIVLEIEYIRKEERHLEKYEVLGTPFDESDFWFVRVRDLETGRIREISLRDVGILPYRDELGEYWDEGRRPRILDKKTGKESAED